MSEELLPCPFCGCVQDDGGDLDDARYFASCGDGRLAWGCSRCETIGPAGHDIAEAIANWNRRHDALAAESARLREALQEIVDLGGAHGGFAYADNADRIARAALATPARP